jgi:hypothetical protein
MHGLSVLAKNTPRPNLIWWRGEDILMFGKEVTFSRYRENTYKKVLQLEQLILKDVLCGIYTRIEEVEEVFALKNLAEDSDEKTPGHGIIANTANPIMRTAESDKFFQRMFEEKKLDIQSNSRGGVNVDQLQGLQWISAIHGAYIMLVAACHVLILAGRGTEWETIRPTNNEDGRKGVVYDPGACTGAFDAEYHKGLNVQGMNKHNRRYMPWEIFRLLYILLRIVRPLELMVLFATIIPDTDKPATIQAYNKHLFASMGKAWKSADISKALQDWFMDVIDFPLGLHDYRHMAVAIQRKYMDLRNKEPSELDVAINVLRGHKKAVGDSHYARETYLGTCSPEDRDRALELARKYHEVMGFATGFNDELKPEAKKLRAEFSYQPPAIFVPMKKLKGHGDKGKTNPTVALPPLPPPTPKKERAKVKPAQVHQFKASRSDVPVQLRRSNRERKILAKDDSNDGDF